MACENCISWKFVNDEGIGTLTIISEDPNGLPIEVQSVTVEEYIPAGETVPVPLASSSPAWMTYLQTGLLITVGSLYRLTTVITFDFFAANEAGEGPGDYNIRFCIRRTDGRYTNICCDIPICSEGVEEPETASAEIAFVDNAGAIWAGFIDDVLTKIAPDGTVVWSGNHGSTLGLAREAFDGFDAIVYLTEEGGLARVRKIDFDGSNLEELETSDSSNTGPCLTVVSDGGTPYVSWNTTSKRGYVSFAGAGSFAGPNVTRFFAAGLAGSGTDLLIGQTSVDADIMNYQDWSNVQDGPNLTFRGLRTDRSRARLFALVLDTGVTYLREYNTSTFAEISSVAVAGGTPDVLCGVDLDLGLAYCINTAGGKTYIASFELDGSNLTHIVNITDDLGVSVTNTLNSAILL